MSFSSQDRAVPTDSARVTSATRARPTRAARRSSSAVRTVLAEELERVFLLPFSFSPPLADGFCIVVLAPTATPLPLSLTRSSNAFPVCLSALLSKRRVD